LSHETCQKNWQGGLDQVKILQRRECIPRKIPQDAQFDLKALIERFDPSATSLFNHCVKNASLDENIWYSNTSVKQYQFSHFMSDISRNADCSRLYTPHCLRPTDIQGMNDAGYEIRHIMYMSGHKNEGSVRSYNRDCSSTQKKAMSDSLQLISSGNLQEQTSRQPLSQIRSVAVSRPV